MDSKAFYIFLKTATKEQLEHYYKSSRTFSRKYITAGFYLAKFGQDIREVQLKLELKE